MLYSLVKRYLPLAYAGGCVITFAVAASMYFLSAQAPHFPPGSDKWICGPDDTSKRWTTPNLLLDKVEGDKVMLSMDPDSMSNIGAGSEAKTSRYDVLVRSLSTGMSDSVYWGTVASRWSFDFELTQANPGVISPLRSPKSGVITVANRHKLFPFDQYLVGLAMTIEDSLTERRVSSPLMVTSKLDETFRVTRFDNFGDFLRWQGHHPVRTEGRKALSNECLFVIERASWFKWGVAGLIFLLFAPVLFTVYRADENPGLELITTMVYIGLIRTYLLDIKGMEFHVIDFVFALVIVLVAVIPAARLSFRRGGGEGDD